MEEILSFARQTAYEAGAILMGRRPDPARLQLLETGTKTSPTDLVSALDKESEEFIVRQIQTSFPDDGIVGEEGTDKISTSGRRWIIDPLDGTINYLYGATQWAVSIAVEDVEGLLVGVVYSPCGPLEYYAVRGQGAYRIDRSGEVRLPILSEKDLSVALFATGFSYESTERSKQADVLQTVLPRIQDIRRHGAAALDLCMVADGSVDGYFEVGAKPWDYSAGVLIARESGALASGLFGRDVSPQMVVCAAPKLQQAMITLLESIPSLQED